MSRTSTTATESGTETAPPPLRNTGGDDDGTGPQGSGGYGGGGGANGGGGGGGGNNGNNAGGQPPAAPSFALAPAYVPAANTFIDYSTRYGQRLYEASVAPLPHEYDCQEEGLREFVRSLKDRAVTSNWEPTLQIQQGGRLHDLFDSYGSLTVRSIRAHAETYIGFQVRNAQNSFAIYTCLAASLTEGARNRVAAKLSDYTIDGQFDGLLYFKAIIQTAQVDTRATVTDLKTKLLTLNLLMSEVGSDIVEFNSSVTAWEQALNARGEQVGETDLLVNLFRGYKCCEDEEFQRWTKMKLDEYNEGKDITPKSLMELAQNKYNSMVKEGTWKAPTKEQETIVSLNAQVTQLKKTIKANNKLLKKAKKGDKQQDDKDKSGKPDKEKKKREYPAWKKIAPKTGEPHTKVVNGRTYHWCGLHQLWTAHEEKDCKLKKATNESNTTTTNPNRLQIDRNLAAIAEDDSSI